MKYSSLKSFRLRRWEEKSSEKKCRNTIVGFLCEILSCVFCDTYKQALRGLFVTGTSDVAIAASWRSREIKEKVVDEPGLNYAARRDVLNNLAG